MMLARPPLGNTFSFNYRAMASGMHMCVFGTLAFLPLEQVRLRGDGERPRPRLCARGLRQSLQSDPSSSGGHSVPAVTWWTPAISADRCGFGRLVSMMPFGHHRTYVSDGNPGCSSAVSKYKV